MKENSCLSTKEGKKENHLFQEDINNIQTTRAGTEINLRSKGTGEAGAAQIRIDGSNIM